MKRSGSGPANCSVITFPIDQAPSGSGADSPVAVSTVPTNTGEVKPTVRSVAKRARTNPGIRSNEPIAAVDRENHSALDAQHRVCYNVEQRALVIEKHEKPRPSHAFVEQLTLSIGRDMPRTERRSFALDLDDIIRIIILTPFRAILIAIFYFVSLAILNVSFFKSLAIASFVFISLLAHLADRQLARFGLVLLAYALAYWIGAVPAPAELRDAVASLIHAISGTVAR